MTGQLNIFEVHSHENNRESQLHLDKNRALFSGQCKQVFELLMAGQELTVLEAHVKHGISSLPRRILDLKKKGVYIDDKWVNNVKAYFMTPTMIEINNRKIN